MVLQRRMRFSSFGLTLLRRRNLIRVLISCRRRFAICRQLETSMRCLAIAIYSRVSILFCFRYDAVLIRGLIGVRLMVRVNRTGSGWFAIIRRGDTWLLLRRRTGIV